MNRRPAEQWWLLPTGLMACMMIALWMVPGALGVQTVYLWTDRLLFLLLVMSVFLFAHIRLKEHLRTPWLHVLRRKTAMAAWVILSVYIFIGILDSVHYRKPLPPREGQTEVHYSVEVLSLLDAIAAPLKTRVERTYSAPFAARAYSRETVERPDGTSERIYPRLEYGGAHLTDPDRESTADIAATLARSAAMALLLWLLLFVLAGLVLARRDSIHIKSALLKLARGHTRLPWNVALYTILFVMLLAIAASSLGVKYHILGTDKVGQDVFYQALKSIRTGLMIGTLTTLVMLPFAILLGIAAGYFKGWVDDVIQYVYTTLNSIPAVLLIAAAILSIQVYIANHPQLFQTSADRADLRLLALCVILGITSWTGLCRLLRGETLKVAEMDYVEAAKASGVSHFGIIGRHIFPNVMHIVLIIVVLDFSGLVLAEAVLSYVGVGVDPSTISWGNMINSARLEMGREPVVWWTLAAAFVFMFTLVLSANLFSDAVRDAFDPRVRRDT